MSKSLVGAIVALAVFGVAPTSAVAREYQVKMLNKGPNGQMMVFEPAYLAVKPGDTVKFVATDKGHNAESIPTMTPTGAPAFKGKINEEIVVKFTKPGVYGYKCLPHLGMGMVGLVQVGPGSPNKAQAAAAAAKLPGMGKKVMTGLVAKVR